MHLHYSSHSYLYIFFCTFQHISPQSFRLSFLRSLEFIGRTFCISAVGTSRLHIHKAFLFQPELKTPRGFGGAGIIYLPAMTNNEATTNGHAPEDQIQSESTSFAVKTGLAKMLKGGVIMDVVNAEQVWISSHLHVIQIT